MNRPPEKRADDGDPPPQPEQSPVASPHAVSFGDAIRHHYYDNNGEQEKEQSSSSSDSDSDDDDFFQLEATELGVAAAKPPTAPVFADNEIGVKYLGWKPPAGTRYDVPDPNRIPMSVFARNTATASPKDWSVASNESLFSIQMGNSSFSREQGLLMMGRSGDFEIFASGTMEYPPPRPPPARPAAEGAVFGEKAKLVDVDEVKEDEELEAAMKEKATGYQLSPSISRQSDSSSATSFGSFAFPVLTGEEKSESIKVTAKHHAEHQPPPFINPLKAPAPLPAAAAAPRPPPSAMDLAYTKRRWFPCFSWCQLCC